MANEENDSVVVALMESNDLLQDEVTRLRNSHRILRTVIRTLRATLTTYRGLLETAKFNDDTFKALCEGEFDAPVALTGESGLLNPEGRVEPTVRNDGEASATA